ncbi:MAG: aldehyde dehydrogenase family protein, partial [Elusimicrobia bacterium]|nr:aldehyde dehydrogenase family protein [Elusimicrobiota bacterium]
MNKYSSKQIEYFKTGITHDIDFRLKALRKLKNLILENQEDIIKAVSSDLGRSETEVYTGEIFFVLKEIDLFIKNLKKWSRPKKVKTPILLQPAKSRLLSQPLGTVLIIAPWNYPFQLLIMPLIGAIAAGNCATLKPSEISEETSALVSKIINSNFDEGYIQAVEGDAKVAAGLISEKFDHIFFTGGSGVGRKILAASAENLTPATLELGGKCPCIVTEDADIALAARRIVWGKFFNAGQT